MIHSIGSCAIQPLGRLRWSNVPSSIRLLVARLTASTRTVKAGNVNYQEGLLRHVVIQNVSVRVM